MSKKQSNSKDAHKLSIEAYNLTLKAIDFVDGGREHSLYPRVAGCAAIANYQSEHACKHPDKVSHCVAAIYHKRAAKLHDEIAGDYASDGNGLMADTHTKAAESHEKASESHMRLS